ncbi:MAG: cob(I)yrinic acid a,c-diamide adenosyltransferase [Ruminococcus sp.]|nr:cob(I)yrinic acid a,c-diamide adenosyltransferase [Ruminococcus sp.]
MLHIYYGNGKGKTTAAVGLAVRAAGRNLNVLFAQFLKTEDSGERFALKKLDNINLVPCPDKLKFVAQMTEEEKLECRKYSRNIFDQSIRNALMGSYNMIIFDEIFTAIEHNMLSEGELFDFLANAPQNLEVILTGHNPSERVLALADYATEMVKRAHPYEKGVSARKGIEY